MQSELFEHLFRIGLKLSFRLVNKNVTKQFFFSNSNDIFTND